MTGETAPLLQVERRPRRVRTTRASVLLFDRVARIVITLGGIGTILAVSMVCVFLVWVVLPLFQSEDLGPIHSQLLVAPPSAATDPAAAEELQRLAVDEYGNLAWTLTTSGKLHVVRIQTGELLNESRLIEGAEPRAWSFGQRGGEFAVGLADGSVRLGRIRFVTSFLSGADAEAAQRSLGEADQGAFRDGLVQRTSDGQYRLQRVVTELDAPLATALAAPPALIDVTISERATVFAVISEQGELRIAQVTRRKNMLTGKVDSRLRQGRLEVVLPEGQRPLRLLLSATGDAVFLVWRDGRLLRVNASNLVRPAVVESLAMFEQPGTEVTAITFLNGQSSIVVGDSRGGLGVWFRVKPEEASTPDGTHMVRAHQLPSDNSPAVALASSVRSRMLAALTASGQLRVYHVTSQQQLAVTNWDASLAEKSALAMAPRDDAIFAATREALYQWKLHAPHPEVTFSSILGRVWYENYEWPAYVWQSSSGTDDLEEKYSLIPLIFGTLKATFYSMLFGAPLAYLAAIYTSEFLHPRTKARVKPTIEIMASLPSVVLGFLGALVMAPVIEDAIPETLLVLVCVPVSFLLGAYLWQLLPRPVAARHKGSRTWAMLVAFPIGLLLAWKLGDPVERWLFAGDCKAWLDGRVGTGLGAWMILMLPCTAMLFAWLSVIYWTPLMRRLLGDSSATRFAVWDLVRFVFTCLATVFVAYAISICLSFMDWDPRGTFVDTYVQRNALVVGLMMGFAIIPIIYTISDDALGAVPESLRAGSLGAGATPWQTAMRVVIPTAMSGLFSAFMVGLGRAVGETMIVLMAAGNTPVMEWNIFSGLRSLSANIAVELPEAVAKSTHYRMLFVAALTLFAVTFVVNTVAEVVRQRFRKRAFQL